MIAQVHLSGAQLGVLRFVCEAGDKPVPTSGTSNFQQGWVSGQVAAALIGKGLLRRIGSLVVPTPAGRRLVDDYLESEQ